MPINQIRDLAQKSIEILEGDIDNTSGIVIDDKFTYLREIEVIRALLQNTIFWADILIAKNITKNLDQVDDTIW